MRDPLAYRSFFDEPAILEDGEWEFGEPEDLTETSLTAEYIGDDE